MTNQTPLAVTVSIRPDGDASALKTALAKVREQFA